MSEQPNLEELELKSNQSSDSEEQVEQKQPTFEDIMQKLMGTIFKQVMSSDLCSKEVKKVVKEEVDEVVNNDDPNIELSDDDVDGESLSAPSISDEEKEEDMKIPKLNDLVSLFGKTAGEIDGAIASIGTGIKIFLSDVKRTSEIKEYFLNQLETCNLNDAKKNTFEHFELDSETELNVTITISNKGTNTKCSL